MAGQVDLDKRVFTTFEVAKICNANITSIKNWIVKDKLDAFQTPGGHYRIERDVLIDFLDEYRMPNPFVERDEQRVMVLCQDPATVELVRRGVGRGVEVEGTDDPTEAALALGTLKPSCLVVDLMMKDMSGLLLVKRVRQHYQLNRMTIIAYCASDDVTFEREARDAGVDHYVRASEGIDTLRSQVRKVLH